MKAKPEKLWCIKCVIKNKAYLYTSTLARTRSEAIKNWMAMWDCAETKPHYMKWSYWCGSQGYRCVKVEVCEVST